MPTYYALSTIASVLCFILAVVWLLLPHHLMSLWKVPYTPGAGFVSRRNAALFLGLAVMLLLLRDTGPSATRHAVSLGFAVCCLGLACLGLFELIRKRVSIAILPAILVESLLAIAFFIQ